MKYYCIKHPDFISSKTYAALLQGVGCTFCNSGKSPLTYEYVSEYFTQHNCKLLSSEYKTVDHHLEYMCECGNVDIITFYKFRMGRRCRQCSIAKANHSGIKLYFEDVKKYVENTGYKLGQDFYKNTTTKMKFICDQGHEYEATLKNFRKGRRCPDCRPVSRGQDKIQELLEKLQIDFIMEKTYNDLKSIHSLRYDFYISNKVIIEFDGNQHFKEVKSWDGKEGFEKRKKHDIIKNTYCIDNDIPLFRIPYWDLENIEYILNQILAYYKIINQDSIDADIIHKYHVNRPGWSHEEYITNIVKKSL